MKYVSFSSDSQNKSIWSIIGKCYIEETLFDLSLVSLLFITELFLYHKLIYILFVLDFWCHAIIWK